MILKCEFGYFIDKEYQDKGIMTDNIAKHAVQAEDGPRVAETLAEAQVPAIASLSLRLKLSLSLKLDLIYPSFSQKFKTYANSTRKNPTSQKHSVLLPH